MEASLDEEQEAREASCELPTHRAIYARTPARTVLHTHPPHGIVLSLLESRIAPLDVEGCHLVGEVPVVSVSSPVGSLEMADLIAQALLEYRLCMLRGHGLFVRGETLDEAFCLTTAFEASARVSYLARLVGISVLSGECADGSERGADDRSPERVPDGSRQPGPAGSPASSPPCASGGSPTAAPQHNPETPA